MKRTGTKETNDLLSMSRRDVLKIMGAGALFAMLPGYGLGGSAAEFSPSGGQGLIFLVGDGMPLGVSKGCIKSELSFTETKIRISTQR